MPYIKKEFREQLEESVQNLYDEAIAIILDDQYQDIGGLFNYIFTKIIHKFLSDHLSYYDLNMMVGVLECVKLELYRKIVSPYEDIRSKENGPVSDLDGGVA